MVQGSKLPPRSQDPSIFFACQLKYVALIQQVPKWLLHFCIPAEVGMNARVCGPLLHIERLLLTPLRLLAAPFSELCYMTFLSYRTRRNILFLFCSSYNRGGGEKVVVNPFSLFLGLYTQCKIRGDFLWEPKF